MWTQRRSGITKPRSPLDHRDAYERDYNRVIHSPAFRRLQRKTQILGTREGDFHRTRLTHSLEVASISRSITKHLHHQQANSAVAAILASDDLISVISLLHDIGHPPFGHGGEIALNCMMAEHGGFEGNAQSLRLLTKLENSYAPHGLDLTRRTLLGILKYPAAYQKVKALEFPEFQEALNMTAWLPPKCYFDCEQAEVDWLLMPLSTSDRSRFEELLALPHGKEHGKSCYKSLDCTIMDIADDIAYGVHDLEDAIHLKLIEREQLATPEFNYLFKYAFASDSNIEDSEQLVNMLFTENFGLRKQAIGDLVNCFIVATNIQVTHPSFEEALIRYAAVLTPAAKQLLDYFIKIIYEAVINSHQARTVEYGAQTVVQLLFKAIAANPDELLDLHHREQYQQHGIRVICDYIASMTDEYAYRMHQRLFGFNTRTVFERF